MFSLGCPLSYRDFRFNMSVPQAEDPTRTSVEQKAASSDGVGDDFEDDFDEDDFEDP